MRSSGITDGFVECKIIPYRARREAEYGGRAQTENGWGIDKV